MALQKNVFKKVGEKQKIELCQHDSTVKMMKKVGEQQKT
jgi:uncharacterized pyridoxamine 5'-phosphate oxidase family protein